MEKFKKILVPIDFSPVAKNAVEFANGILEKQSAEVILVNVITSESTRTMEEVNEQFRIFEAEVLKDLNFNYSFKVFNGEELPGIDLLAGLIKANHEINSDLIIMGTRAERNSDISLASALIRSVECPVLVVPDDYTEFKIKKIAFANDYKPIRESESIKPLWEFALEFGAKVYLFHVEQSTRQAVLADEAESTLEYYLDALDHEYVYIKNQDMEQAIIDFDRENNIDLLVILSRDHGSNELKSEGKLVKQLTTHAKIPVLAIS